MNLAIVTDCAIFGIFRVIWGYSGRFLSNSGLFLALKWHIMPFAVDLLFNLLVDYEPFFCRYEKFNPPSLVCLPLRRTFLCPVAL